MKLPDLNLFKRNFVSIVFTSSRILVLKMNSKLDTVESFGQRNIPPGVIMNYRVGERKVLADSIKDLWKELKLKEKFVGVVVPEFATYTKVIDLPNLSDTEINEALNWQVQEYLPAPIEELIFDWKIINRSSDTCQILVVSILKDVLMGYIDVVGDAGLYPLVVETPSLSIERITSVDDDGKLIIYLSKPEALLVLTQGHKIVASSVVSSDNLNIIVSTALQTMSHYKEVEVKRVLIGGVGLTEDLISHLNYNLARPVNLLNLNLKGMAPAQIQDFLLAVSLQMKDPAEPASEATINLLPITWAEKYKKEMLSIKNWTLTLIVSIITWSTFLLALIVFVLLSFQAEELKKEGNTGVATGFSEIVSQVQKVNTKAEKLISIHGSIISYSDPLNKIAGYKNENIQISRYTFNLENGLVTISGLSTNREGLIDFKSKIDEDPDFSEINNFPVTSLIAESNIPFVFEIQYLPLTQPAKQNFKLKL